MLSVLDTEHRADVLRAVVASGSLGMTQLIARVVRLLPCGLVSKRQLRRDIVALAVKEKRAGDRAARWYARETALSPDELDAHAAEDAAGGAAARDNEDEEEAHAADEDSDGGTRAG